MNSGAGKFEGFFQARGPLVCLGLGIGVAAAFYVLSMITTAGTSRVVFMFSNFPFSAWLIVTLVLVLFSQRARDLLVNEEKSPVGGFFLRLFSPFGLFYYGWRIGFLVLVGSGSQ